MRFHRAERVSSLIKERLSRILLKEIEVPDVLITLTEVEVDKKLERAKVRFSVLPSEKTPEVLKVLSKQAPRLRFILLREINIKPMPQIIFEIDRGPEKAAEVEKILLRDNNGNK